MSKGYKIRWAAVLCIWSIVMGITYWNGLRIEEISAFRQDNELNRAELSFQRRHVGVFSRIAGQADLLYLPVDSPKLGLVQMDHQLYALAAGFDLQDVNLGHDVNPGDSQHLPYRLTARGRIDQVAGFLTVLEEHPYLIEKHTHIEMIAEEGACLLEVAFIIQYQLIPPTVENSAPSSPWGEASPSGRS